MFIEQKKEAFKKFDPRTWCTKKPFGYRVIHHRYSLMSCPGQYITKLEKQRVKHFESFIVKTIKFKII